jgi:triphosphoribosyl-dephospho-CoA synthase
MKALETHSRSSWTNRETAVAAAVKLACHLEASAPKPGNVSPGRPFHDSCYEDFIASAAAIAEPIAMAGRQPLGATVWAAIEATARTVPSNTNLGIVLLFAPLARAALRLNVGSPATLSDASLRDSLRRVLLETTVDDARTVYAAIRHAAPGGLGRADEQDVAEEPTVTLLEAMRLAAHRDGIAHEYVTAFERTFSTGVPTLARAKDANLPWDDAVLETFLTILAETPDSHIARRAGGSVAADVSRRSANVLVLGGVRTDRGQAAIQELDDALRDPAHLTNPGTSADITAASIFASLLISEART